MDHVSRRVELSQRRCRGRALAAAILLAVTLGPFVGRPCADDPARGRLRGWQRERMDHLRRHLVGGHRRQPRVSPVRRQQPLPGGRGIVGLDELHRGGPGQADELERVGPPRGPRGRACATATTPTCSPCAAQRVELLRIVSGSATTLGAAASPSPSTPGTRCASTPWAPPSAATSTASSCSPPPTAPSRSGLVGAATDYATANFDDFVVTAGGHPPQQPGASGPGGRRPDDRAAVLGGPFRQRQRRWATQPTGSSDLFVVADERARTVTFSPNAATLTARRGSAPSAIYTLDPHLLRLTALRFRSHERDRAVRRRPAPSHHGPVGFAAVNAWGQNGTTGGAGGPTVDGRHRGRAPRRHRAGPGR